jgi:hypothetical protein
MKVNLKKLKEIEKEYQEQELPAHTLRLMLSQVLAFGDTSYKLAPNNIQLAISTLKELGILTEMDIVKPVQQLNS